MVICDLKQRKSQDGQVTTSSLVMCWPFKTKGKFKKMNIENRMLTKNLVPLQYTLANWFCIDDTLVPWFVAYIRK